MNIKIPHIKDNGRSTLTKSDLLLGNYCVGNCPSFLFNVKTYAFASYKHKLRLTQLENLIYCGDANEYYRH